MYEADLRNHPVQQTRFILGQDAPTPKGACCLEPEEGPGKLLGTYFREVALFDQTRTGERVLGPDAGEPAAGVASSPRLGGARILGPARVCIPEHTPAAEFAREERYFGPSSAQRCLLGSSGGIADERHPSSTGNGGRRFCVAGRGAVL